MTFIEQLKQCTEWEQRYRLIIQAGKQLSRPTAEELSQWTSIQGCEAGLWVQISAKNDRTLHFQAYSEARIINGLLSLLINELHNQPLEAAKTLDMTEFFTSLGIAQRLSQTRLNGLRQIEKLLKQSVL